MCVGVPRLPMAASAAARLGTVWRRLRWSIVPREKRPRRRRFAQRIAWRQGLVRSGPQSLRRLVCRAMCRSFCGDPCCPATSNICRSRQVLCSLRGFALSLLRTAGGQRSLSAEAAPRWRPSSPRRRAPCGSCRVRRRTSGATRRPRTLRTGCWSSCGRKRWWRSTPACLTFWKRWPTRLLRRAHLPLQPSSTFTLRTRAGCASGAPRRASWRRGGRLAPRMCESCRSAAGLRAARWDAPWRLASWARASELGDTWSCS
mmetsp:Transcript_69221/g.175950  ORF Transcript_69221/g.175950 Transcript_69221/m.175950 type:complete len:259 (-) Transcript_69221:187-963(-)